VGEFGLDISGSGQRAVLGCYEYGNEVSGSIKCREFVEYLTVSFSRRALLHKIN
jgi:hypothetical protein